jgi:hypothetical protein
MSSAALAISIVSLVISLSALAASLVFWRRARRERVAEVTLILSQVSRLEESLERMGEGGYVILRMLMERGLVDEEELTGAWRAYVEEPRERAREYAELLKEWKERGETGSVLVDERGTKLRH